MRSLNLILIVSALTAACATPTTVKHQQSEEMAQAQIAGRPVLIYQVQTKYLQNISPQGGYTQVKFINTSDRRFVAIAFEVVPYADGEPILQTVSAPVVFGAKGNFNSGGYYSVTSARPVWPADMRYRVNCVHLVGLVLQFADGQIERVDRGQIANYLNSKIVPQNCSNPSTPGPHN